MKNSKPSAVGEETLLTIVFYLWAYDLGSESGRVWPGPCENQTYSLLHLKTIELKVLTQTITKHNISRNSNFLFFLFLKNIAHLRPFDMARLLEVKITIIINLFWGNFLNFALITA